MAVYRTPKGTSYELTEHALKRMAQRSIRRKDVEDALDNYDTRHPDQKGTLCHIAYLEDGRRLKVIVAKESDPLVIITVVAI